MQHKAIAAEYALLVRCFKAWAVVVRSHRNSFHVRLLDAKANLYRRATLLGNYFDAWVKFVDVPDMAT